MFIYRNDLVINQHPSWLNLQLKSHAFGFTTSKNFATSLLHVKGILYLIHRG